MVFCILGSEGVLMTMPINDRLKAVRNALKLSQRDFSRGIYTSQSNYARIEQGSIKINDRIIELVCSKYKVNREYLKNGKGAMFSGSPPDVKLEQLSRIFHELNGLFQDYLLVQARELLKVQMMERKENLEDLEVGKVK